MINEASTLLSVVTTDKATTEGFGSQETSECSDRPFLAFRVLHGPPEEGRRTGME